MVGMSLTIEALGNRFGPDNKTNGRAILQKETLPRKRMAIQSLGECA
jgi:hypothetical protein